MNDIDHEQEYSRRWEDEASFNDVLAEQIRKAPYVLISIAVHAVLAFIISGWIILTSTTSDAPTITVQAPPPPPDIEEEEPPEEEIVEEIVEEPVLQENEIEEVVEQETLEDEGDPDFNSDAPFDADSWNNDVGLGGGAGGKYGKRGGMGGRRGGNATEKAVLSALKWLADHQTTEGFWDCDEFPLEDKYPNEPPSTGPGNPVNDVGVTGLALLARASTGRMCHVASTG